VVVLDDPKVEEVRRLIGVARELSKSLVVEYAGKTTPENVREYAAAGAQLISVQCLTNAPAMDIGFRVQPF
jgi:nicotinate-nucleotide pyrophosphorylase